MRLRQRAILAASSGVLLSTVGSVGVLVPIAVLGGNPWYAVPAVLLAGAAGAAVGIGMASSFARKLAAPLDHMARVAGRLKQGPEGVEVSSDQFRRSGSEVGLLLREFEEMIAAMKQRDLDQEMQIRELHTSLEKATGEARKHVAAEEAKDAFLARMSHELRTPLNAIIGYSEVLLEDAQSAGHNEYVDDLNSIAEAARGLLWQIQSVLDLTDLKAGRYKISPEDVVLTELADTVLEAVRPVADQFGNRLVRDVPPDVGTVRVDRTMTFQILFNLAGNACKFTRSGEVTLQFRRFVDTVDLIVRDNGMGLTRRQVEQLFQPFSQVEDSSTQRYGGAGVGLAVCKGFAELMGGTIRVVSEPGRGASVTLTLPVDVTPAKGPAERIIEDDPTALYR